MTRSKLAALSGGVAASALLAGMPARAALLDGNVAAFTASAPMVRAVPDSQVVEIAVHMKLRDPDGLKQLAHDVSTPGSPSYGRYLSVEQFNRTYAAEDADVAAVKAVLADAGMTDIVAGPAGAYVRAEATVGQLRQAFGVTQAMYTLGDRTVRANREAPRVPDVLAGKVLFIEGLDETDEAHTTSHSVVEGTRLAPAAVADVSPPVTPPPVAANLPSPYCDHYWGDLNAKLSTAPYPYAQKEVWLSCGYTPQQIEAAYGQDKTKFDGAGITVGIIDAYASPTLRADITRYAKGHGLPAITDANYSEEYPHKVLSIPENTAVCGGVYGWWGEQSLDVAAVHGSAPGATIKYIGALNCKRSLTLALFDAIYMHKADVLTNSYSFNGDGISEKARVAGDQAFMAAAAMGISVLFSSGDAGDLSQTLGFATASAYGTSPYATAVGGTTLALRDAAGTKTEWGWGTYRDYLNNVTVNSGTSVTTTGLATTTVLGYTFPAMAFYSGAGGGISTNELQPDYQKGVVPNKLAITQHYASGYVTKYPEPHRVVPDVSALADPYTGYLIGETFTVAGNAVSDYNCTKLTTTTEYCELGYGGTSLASPLVAGMIAVINQSRAAHGKALVGFANPALYKLASSKTPGVAPILDVVPASHPVSLLRGYASNLNLMRLVTVNSVSELIKTVPFTDVVCGAVICQGLDDVFLTTAPGYDTVTGVGTPWLPKLVD